MSFQEVFAVSPQNPRLTEVSSVRLLPTVLQTLPAIPHQKTLTLPLRVWRHLALTLPKHQKAIAFHPSSNQNASSLTCADLISTVVSLPQPCASSFRWSVPLDARLNFMLKVRSPIDLLLLSTRNLCPTGHACLRKAPILFLFPDRSKAGALYCRAISPHSL